MRVIVAHPEQQHSYHLAIALKKAGMLDKYTTTVYYKKCSLTYFASFVLPKRYKERARLRRSEELSNSDVVLFCQCLGLLKLFCDYFPPFKKHYQKVRTIMADRFALKVADYAIKRNVDVVVTYDNCSPLLFERIKEKAPRIIRVMDMSAASLLFMKQIYEKDFALAPAFAESLKNERSYIWDDKYINRIEREISTSHFFMIPSSFVRRSLAFSGIHDGQMIYCPYGVDTKVFNPKKVYKPEGSPIKFIYVGGVKELKGIYYLLECFSSISTDIARLTVIGPGELSNSCITKYSKKVCFKGLLPHSQIATELRDSDVFIFPSLGDSFSLAALEAAACGLPLIVTRNTGMCDLVDPGKTGFIVEEQSVESLNQAVQWFIENPDQIRVMGSNASEMSRHVSWNRYEETVKNSFLERLSGLGRKDYV